MERGIKTPRGRPASAVCTEKESALENIAKKMSDIRIRLKELAEMIPKNEEKGKGENRWGATKGIVVGGRGGIGSSLSSLSEDGVMGATRRKSVSVDASECAELDLRQKSPIAQAGHRSMHRRQPSSDGLESVPISVTSFRRQQIKFDGQADQVPRHEYLHQLWRKKFQVMFAARQAQDEKEMQHCTFRPFTNAAGPKVDRDGPVGERSVTSSSVHIFLAVVVYPHTMCSGCTMRARTRIRNQMNAGSAPLKNANSSKYCSYAVSIVCCVFLVPADRVLSSAHFNRILSAVVRNQLEEQGSERDEGCHHQQ